MTSAIYLNNIPNLGHVSHAIKILNVHSKNNLKLIFDINESVNYDNLYVLENFADFIKPTDCINFFNFLKFCNVNTYIFISEDPNFFNISDPHNFLLNYKCDFKFYVILFIIRKLNISLFSYLYNYLFINDKFFVKVLRNILLKFLKVDHLQLLWTFRSSIYSRVLEFKKNVIIPNKRTLGPNRILQSTFGLKVWNSSFTDFDLDASVDPFSYQDSIVKINFKNLFIHIESNNSSFKLERLCYLNNLISEDSLSIYFKSISHFFSEIISFIDGLANPLSSSDIQIIIYTEYESIYFKYDALAKFLFFNNYKDKYNLNISQSKCL